MLLKYLLLGPLSLLYGLGVDIRNRLFDWRLLKIREFDVPIICIGNITVGGTGKTPHTEALIGELRRDFRVACLSRGYKRRTSGFVLATPESTAKDIGGTWTYQGALTGMAENSFTIHPGITEFNGILKNLNSI